MIVGLLHETMTISRPVVAHDGQGGYTAVPVVVGTAPGRVRAARAAEIARAGQRGYAITHVIYAAMGTDVRRGDTVAIGGDTFRVQWVAVARGLVPGGHHLELEAEAVQRGGG